MDITGSYILASGNTQQFISFFFSQRMIHRIINPKPNLNIFYSENIETQYARIRVNQQKGFANVRSRAKNFFIRRSPYVKTITESFPTDKAVILCLKRSKNTEFSRQILNPDQRTFLRTDIKTNRNEVSLLSDVNQTSHRISKKME